MDLQHVVETTDLREERATVEQLPDVGPGHDAPAQQPVGGVARHLQHDGHG